MSDEIARQLVKHLKRLNFWVTIFGTVFLVTLVIIGIVLFKIVMFVQEVNTKVQSAGSSLDVKRQVCEGTGSFSNFIRKSTKACE